MVQRWDDYEVLVVTVVQFQISNGLSSPGILLANNLIES